MSSSARALLRNGCLAFSREVPVDPVVRTLCFVARLGAVERTLLPPKSRGRRSRGLPLQVPVHAFVLAVLVRARRSDPLVHNVRLHPPDVQRAQTMDSRRGERRLVVGTDRFGESRLPKQLQKRRLGALGPDRKQALTHQQLPAEVVRHREWIAGLRVRRLELALEVHRPNLVRSVGLERDRTRVFPPSAPPLLVQFSVALEDCGNRAPGRELDPRVSLLQGLEQLLRAPAVLLPEPDDPPLDRGGRAVRARLRRPLAVPQARFLLGLHPVHPRCRGCSRTSVEHEPGPAPRPPPSIALQRIEASLAPSGFWHTQQVGPATRGKGLQPLEAIPSGRCTPFVPDRTLWSLL